ncbi:PH and SEC7 domain-containing protein 3 isoform X2 [Mauremys reevesii]|uniref:PH and SEC7 domain-containing protein 3 isoform X2 n=1 Tax=Mauremys reevesii TaxID=260615 RepID=UPI00193EF838|nr:PH and SEC7 domain-containing protein 3 isoform X2 [Mauremys reevesii]
MEAGDGAAEAFVWVNDALAHSQSVAKAKYEFQFGGSETQKPSETGGQGDSTLLPHNVSNEFSEYGTMEQGAEALKSSSEFLAEAITCSPERREDDQLPTLLASGTYADEPISCIEASLLPSKEETLPSADRQTEIMKISQELEAAKVQKGANASLCSELQMEKERNIGSQGIQAARELFPAGQEKPSDEPLPSEIRAEEKLYLIIEKDLAAIVTGEMQLESLQAINNKTEEVPKVKETSCHRPSVPALEADSEVGGVISIRGEGWSDFEKEFSVYNPGEMQTGPGRRISKEAAVSKHVEFQGVEILWIQKAEEQKGVKHSVLEANAHLQRAVSVEKKFSKASSHPIPASVSSGLVTLSESVWNEAQADFKPGVGSESFSLALLAEGGEDEVFVKDKLAEEKNHVLNTDSERIMEEEEAATGGYEDVLGQRHAEVSIDVYSSQFENILDNASLYYSAESLETLYSEPDSYFSFEMPLTPMIQQRIKEGSQFLERTSASGQQDVCKLPTNGEIKSQCGEISSGLRDVSDTLFRRDVTEVTHLDSNAGLKNSLFDSAAAMGSNELLEKDSTENHSKDLSNGTDSNLEAARRLAKRLYQLDRFKRSDVAKHLGKNNEFSKLVAEEYLKFFDFTGMTLDHSLRSFFKAFSLIGETQERERVLIHFSNRYYQCNPNTISTQDGVHCLTCAVMLLNTDLHGHALYNSIKNEKLDWAVDEEEKKKSHSDGTDEKDNGPHSKAITRIGHSNNPFLDIPHDPNAAVYKTGFLARKIHADMDGKRTPRGKRGWKTFYAVLKGTVLYLQKDEYKPEKALSEEDLKNAVSVHHALASKATDYEKRPNVLKLKTADWRVLLFQAQSPEEMQAWINKINCVAAIFSAPPFPAAIGSQKKFSRPLLPATTTKLSQDEQLKSHEAKLKQISTELAEHRSYPPDKKLKGKEVDDYKLKDHYLEFEKIRYEIYVALLKEGGKELLSSGENDGPGLKKSHSSPSLNQESPVSAKVKRNISERKDYRPETPSIKQKVT